MLHVVPNSIGQALLLFVEGSMIIMWSTTLSKKTSFDELDSMSSASTFVIGMRVHSSMHFPAHLMDGISSYNACNFRRFLLLVAMILLSHSPYASNMRYSYYVSVDDANQKASAVDVALLILNILGPMSPWRLQKLVYYAQAWSLVWDDSPLFSDPIEAWAGGPVIQSLYELHKGQLEVSELVGASVDRLEDGAMKTVREVIAFYGDKSGQWLGDLSRSEKPWIRTRQGLDTMDRSDRVIRQDVIACYYGSIL